MDEALYQPFPIPTRARAHIWRHAPATRRPRHFHAEPELNLVTGGSASFAMGEKLFPVVRGDLLWWPPGQDHVLVDASDDFDLFVIGVTADFSMRVLADTPDVACVGPIHIRLPTPALAEIEAICLARGSASDVPAIERRVGDLWRQAHALRRAAEAMHVVTRRTMASLYQQPELGRSDIARLVRAYPTEISRYFHSDMGMTLSAFRSRLRLLRFIQAVGGGAPSLLAAALGAGFGSYSQCHRIFQRTFACTPRSFFETSLRDQMQNAFAPWGTDS
ncbi:MAG: helix-turn-helix domain-containing protein [Deltaproteobacteria bacterium]|nr:helix-turn-helix domain-containing protein [Deltaproteobacteria bacterium]